MAKLLLLLSLAFGLSMAEDARFVAELPIRGQSYPVTARIYTQKTADSIVFSAEMQYRSIDTSFSMHTTGVYNTAKNMSVWQNTVRTGLYSVEWNFRDYRETPAFVYWSVPQGTNSTTFKNEVIPEEFLYFLTEKINAPDSSRSFEMLSSTWELPFEPKIWTVDAKYTERKMRIDGVDCFHVLYKRDDGATAEYYISEKGRQVWRFQTFRGVWFKRLR